ncbi:alpha/beta hydrolase [Streptomyces sp. NPDC127092]|uniref:alpha/beta hydrolase n=1 Tax=Streptomyces sp. NPDC127092 TaxID=3347135 RepID=UPI00365B181A
MPVDPAIVALMEKFGVGGPEPATPPTLSEAREGLRKLTLAAAPRPPLAVGSVTDDTVAGIPVRIYRPQRDGTAATVVFFHGGGFVAGDLDTHDSICRRLCRDVEAVVVGVAYRLAPEHPFPAAYEDALAVSRRIAHDPESFGGGPLALAGDSAGGNLAASVALAFRDEGIPVAAQLLVYPCADLTRGPEYSSLAENAHGYMLTASDLDACLAAYINDDPALAKQFPPSPLRAVDHRGVAPAVIGQGDNDALRDLTLAYADALRAAGVTVRLHRYPGLIHAFLHFDALIPSADAAAGEMYADFKKLITAAT